MSLRLWITAIATTTLVTTGIAVKARTSSTAEVVATAMNRFENADIQGFAELLAPNTRFDNVFNLPNTPRTFEGKDAVVANLTRITENFEQIEFVDERLYTSEDGQTVFVEANGNFTVKGTGEPYNNTYVFVFEVENGQIVAIREYNNPLTIAETFNIPLTPSADNTTE